MKLFKNPLFDTLVPLTIILVAAFFLLRDQNRTTNVTAQPTPTPVTKEVPSSKNQKSEIHSSDGTMKTVMEIKPQQNDTTAYSFTVSGISGAGEHPLFTKTVGKDGSMLLPPNSWSPNNKYLFIQEKKGDSINALVFKASGEPFAKGEDFLDIGENLAKKKPGTKLKEATGWAASDLVQITTASQDGKGSYWFVIETGSFLQHL